MTRLAGSCATWFKKILVGNPELTSSNAYTSDHPASPSIIKLNGIAPGTEWRRHAASASQPNIPAAIIRRKKRINCPCIILLLSGLRGQFFGRVLLHSVFLVVLDPVA